MDNRAQYEVVWPLGRVSAAAITETPRLADLSTATIGFLWTNNFRGDRMFSILQEELSKRHPQMRFVDHATFGNIHGANEHEVIQQLPDLLRANRVDAVVVGVGA